MTLRTVSVLVALALAAPVGGQSVQYRSAAGVEYRSLSDTTAIAVARQSLAADTATVDGIIRLGLAQSSAWQFREAIETFTRGLAASPENPVLLRWRGHRHLSVREFDRASLDLSRGLRRDSAGYGLLYHLGIAHYARGRFAGAADAFRRAQLRAPDGGELAGATDWLWMSLMRAGRTADARAMLDRRPDSIPVANAYGRRLMLYRGEIGPAETLTAQDTAAVTIATLSYGIGNWHLLRGDTAVAREWFDRSIASGAWPAFGFIMAEVELRRLQYVASRPDADSVATVLTALGHALTPLRAALDSAIQAIRQDSGAIRADSAYWRFRAAFGAGVDATMRAFNNRGFQHLTFPDGAEASIHRSRSGLRGMDASSSERAVAAQVVSHLEAYGVRTYRGEGDAYFETDETLLAQVFSPYLSPAGRRLAQLLVLEQSAPTAADASINLTWDQLAERVAESERFVQTYPHAPGRALMADRHRQYLMLFLAGADNTDAFHRRTGVLDPEIRASLERYVLNNGGTESGKTVSRYLDLLKTTGYKRTAAVTRFLRAIDRR